MRLNKSTNDAIQILLECARAETELVKVADLSARLGITQQNVFKIVHMLSRAELVAPVRGRYGGVRLSRPASKIRIGDVVRAMETTAIETERREAEKSARGAMQVNRVLDSAMLAFVEVLDQHSLADMIAAASGRPAGKARSKSAKGGSTQALRVNSGTPSVRRAAPEKT